MSEIDNTVNPENPETPEEPNYQEEAKKSLEKVGRAQTLRAMEQVIIGFAPKESYIQWLESLPEDVKLSATGRLDNESILLIIEDDELYNGAVKVFAQLMAPVLTGVAAG